MPTQITIDDNTEVLVALYQGRGVQDVARVDPKELAKKSAEALNNAMVAIYGMAKRTVSTIRSIPAVEQPDTIELTFGLKLTTEANAFLASAGSETQITVKLSWDNSKNKKDS
jgi:hypothetical protein